MSNKYFCNIKIWIVTATLLLCIDSTLAQWVCDASNNCTFNSTSATSNYLNYATLYNQNSGISNLTGTISSSNGSTASSIFNNLSVTPPNASMFAFIGQGATLNTAGASGPNITLNDSASISYKINIPVVYLQAQSGWGAVDPTYSSGPSAVINVMSNGTSSTVSQYVTSQPPFPEVSSNYNGANGGNVALSVGPSDSTPIVLSLTGPSNGLIQFTNPPYVSSLPWQPFAAVINAQSNGGTASAIMSAPSAADRKGIGIGSGGNGGDVSVQTAANTTLQIGQVGAPLTGGGIVGISAVSYGGTGALCCTNQVNSSIYPYQYQQTLFNGQLIANASLINSGTNGNGGNVTVVNNALITAQNNLLPNYLGGQYGTGIIGIVAASVGASMQIDPLNLPVNGSTYGVTTPSGLGGIVDVTNKGDIYLPGASSIGILAASTANIFIGPPTLSISGVGGSAGAVTINNTGQIAIGNNSPGTSTLNNPTLSAGIVGISSTGWLFNPFNTGSYVQMSAGNGGNVQVDNAGTIKTYGATSLGIVALSIGNSGLLVNNGNNTSNSYIGSAVTQNGANSSAGSATVTNSGSLITQGASSVGILAAANGSGGLFNNNIAPIYGAMTVNPITLIHMAPLTSGVIMGSRQNAYTADGGSVSVMNTGIIATGIKGGIGEASIGIVAQSVGGGGGSYAGTKGLAWVGDAGGLGGNGGTVSVQNLKLGSILTINDGAIGILAQSIGGGGGNGAGASGLFAAVGGSGGSGGNAGTVSVSNGVAGQSALALPTIITSGDYAAGIVAQSIGGGGGNGGYGKVYGNFVAVGIGGSGGSGGAGGLINFENYGKILSSGDQSQGVLLHSIGGGGGVGGAAVSYSAGAILAVAVSVGGSGGSGGNGGSIGTSTNPVMNAGTIFTSGSDAIGMLAQSIGGGGGAGGSTAAKSFAITPLPEEIPALAISTSIGGSGGAAGNGGSEFFQNIGSITTIGTNSHGLVLQSIGGGGGNGGDASAGAHPFNGEVSLALSVSVGGASGASGSGGAVSLANSIDSSINTYGHNASGILVQSIGGGGGISGVGNNQQPGAPMGDLKISPSIAVGGSSNASGSGGSINLSNDGAIRTYGTNSSAILSQSIGGGGGAGGDAGVHGVAGSISANVAVGGNGASGGNGGSVTVSNSGNISTGALISFPGNNSIAIGGDSHGIVAQSIGGGGGIGGSSDPSAELITTPIKVIGLSIESVENWNTIKNYFSAASAKPPFGYVSKVGVGGVGGGGGVGGVVNVVNSGQIQTIGHRSFGILAQSIGGGGGTGGSVMSGSSAVGNSLSGGIGMSALENAGLMFSTGVNIGGIGGASGFGNTVNITQTGGSSIVTTGYGSHGVVAQSIGGGGGVGADGSIAANTGFTRSASADGGITGSFSIALGKISSTPGSGYGGAVYYSSSSSYDASKGVNIYPSITTYGDNAVGILAQSIGGGGGIGSGGCTNNGLSANASACFTNTAMTPGTSTPINFINGGQLMTFTINPVSSSTSISNSSVVNVNTFDAINVYGSGSIGVVAQSIGGGGGLILGNSANIAAAALPAMGTNLGTGGGVVVNVGNEINLASSATGSIGVLAQSIGGGGGFLGDPNMPLSSSLPSFLGTNVTSNTSTSGGSVGVAVNGAIKMYGANQTAVVAQSIGGGGGFASVNGNVVTQNTTLPQNIYSGSGNTVFVTVAGSILDIGKRGGTVGVFAQSQGNSSTNGNQIINVWLPQITSLNGVPQSSGTIQADTGVVISGGANGSNGVNTVYVGAGSLIEVPRGNNAILSTYGTTNVTNYGTITGGIAIGATPGFSAPPGSINNYGVINATGTISSLNFDNIGSVYVAGAKYIGQTDVYGTFRQGNWAGGLGTTYFDFSTTLRTNDFLNIVANGTSAGTMLQGGQFVMNRIDSNKLPAFGQTALLLTAQGGFLSSSGGYNASPITISDSSPIIVWSLLQQGNNLLAQYQGATSHPSGYSFNFNQQQYLDYIIKAYNAGDAGVEKIMGILASINRPGGGGNGGGSGGGGSGGSGGGSGGGGSGGGGSSGGASNGGGGVTTIDLKSALNALNGTAQTIQSQTIVMTGNTMLGNALSCPTFEKNGTIYGETECVWGKYNGGQMRQATSDVNPGYTVYDNTFSLGIQRKVDDDAFMGAAIRFGLTNSSTANYGANANVGDISVGFKKIIGDYLFGLSAAAGISSQKNNRYTTDYFTGQTYNNTSNSNAYYGGLRARNAYQFNLDNDIYIKPYLDLDGLWIHSPSYQESGSVSGVPLQYGTQNSFNFIASPMIELGARINLASKQNAWVRPFVSAGAMFITNNTTNLTASIIGANSGTYQISTQAPNTVFSANAGIQIFDGDGLDAKLEYSIQAGQGYIGQSGTAKLNYRF